MATKIFLKKDSNQSVATLPNWTGVADIFGAAGGNEVVNIHVGNSDLSSFSASAMTLDQNIEGVYLSQAIGNYQFAANGNEVSIKLGNTVIAKVTVQDDTDGTAITYAGQTTPLALTIAPSSSGFAVKLGDQVLTSTPAAYGETPNPSTGSTEQAPWTLVMGTNSMMQINTFISDGTAVGTGINTTVPTTGYSGSGQNYATSSDKNHAYWSTGSKNGFWSISATSATPVQLSSTASITAFSSTVSNYTMANGYTFFSTGVATNGIAAHTFTLDLTSATILQVDTANNAIWYTKTTAPYGTELYRATLSDTGFTASMVKDVFAGEKSGVSNTIGAITADGKVVFKAFVLGDGYYNEAWVSDGSDQGTFSLSTAPYVSQLTEFNGKVVFEAYGSDSGYELYITDGTVLGTKMFDIYSTPGWQYSSNPTILGTINDKLYFTATDATGLGLFNTDGDTFTKLVAISDSNAQILGYTANKAYFAITDATHGKELWSVDLTATTPTLTLTKDILTGSGSALAGYNLNQQMIGDKILFNAYTSDTAQGWFISDGTEAGTVQLATSLPTDKAIVGNKVFFANSAGVYSADTSAATVSATQLKVGDFSSQTYGVHRLQADSDQAFFLAADEKLYASTGTDVIELASNVDKFKVVAEDALYFIATNSSNVASLWYSDGTASGTRYIEDLTLSANSYDLANAVAIHTVGVSLI